MRSANAACFLASDMRSRFVSPATASTTQISPCKWNSRPSARSVAKVCNTGPGSARPEVSMITRTKLGTAPRARSANRARRVSCRSLRTLQQRQPLPSSTVASLLDRSSASSIPISPYSLTTTAVPAPSGLSSSALIRVVLPEPRKPVTATTGSRAPRARFCRRPKSDASLPPKRVSGPVSKLHFERVEPADVTVDRIDDLALVDEHVVDLDRPARRPRRRLGDKIADLLRLIGIGRVIGTQPAVEIRPQDNTVGFPGVRLWQILIE